MKRVLKKILTKKNRGSSIYILSSIFLLILLFLFSASFYLRAVDTVADNFKTSLDTATLSATVVDLDSWEATHNNFKIIASAKDGALTSKERQEVIKLFKVYQQSLEDNVGLTKDFNFKGGTCGWALHVIAKEKTFRIEDFKIYQNVDSRVYEYSISGPLKEETQYPTISKQYIGELGSTAKTPLVTENGKAVQKVIEYPSIYSATSFDIASPEFLTYWGGEEINQTAKKSSYAALKGDLTQQYN